MKKILFIIILFVSFETLYGQGFQVGLRTGVNDWSEYSNMRRIQRHCWEKELFGRYEVNKWAFELSVVQYNISNEHYEDWSGIYQCWGDVYTYSTETYSFSSYYETGTRVYYNVLNNNLAKRGIKWYWGINTATVSERSSSTIIWNTSAGIDKTQDKRWNGSPLILGICNNVEARLSKYINIHSFVGYDFYPEYISDAFLRNQKYSKLSARFGVSYTLN